MVPLEPRGGTYENEFISHWQSVVDRILHKRFEGSPASPLFSDTVQVQRVLNSIAEKRNTNTQAHEHVRNVLHEPNKEGDYDAAGHRYAGAMLYDGHELDVSAFEERSLSENTTDIDLTSAIHTYVHTPGFQSQGPCLDLQFHTVAKSREHTNANAPVSNFAQETKAVDNMSTLRQTPPPSRLRLGLGARSGFDLSPVMKDQDESVYMSVPMSMSPDLLHQTPGRESGLSMEVDPQTRKHKSEAEMVWSAHSPPLSDREDTVTSEHTQTPTHIDVSTPTNRYSRSILDDTVITSPSKTPIQTRNDHAVHSPNSPMERDMSQFCRALRSGCVISKPNAHSHTNLQARTSDTIFGCLTLSHEANVNSPATVSGDHHLLFTWIKNMEDPPSRSHSTPQSTRSKRLSHHVPGGAIFCFPDTNPKKQLSHRYASVPRPTLIHAIAATSVSHASEYATRASLRLSANTRTHINTHTNATAGTLVVTSRAGVSVWEDTLRTHVHKSLSFHSYTEPLNKRCHMGVRKLQHFDIVITTHEILRAKEVSVPIKEAMKFTERVSKSWVMGRIQDKVAHLSQLHMHTWARVVLDDAQELRYGTTKFETIHAVSSLRRWIVFCSVPSGPLDEKMRKAACAFLGLASLRPLEDVTFATQGLDRALDTVAYEGEQGKGEVSDEFELSQDLLEL